MTAGYLTEFLDYGSWANARFFDAVEALIAQRDWTGDSRFDAIKARLAHIVGAEWFWLCRWTDKSLPPDTQSMSVSELKARLAAVEAERREFLTSLTDGDLDRVVAYQGPDEPFSLPLRKLIWHVVNHSGYHRGEIAAYLRQLGQTPPNTDFTRYLVSREQRVAPNEGTS